MNAPRRLAALLATLVAVVAAPAGAGAQPLQFGAFTTGDPYWGHTDGTDTLERVTGRRVAIVSWFQSWGGGSWNASVQRHALDAVAAGGRIPLLTWEPWDPNGGAEQPDYRLARIADGEFDGYIAAWATGLRAHGGPVFLRPMHEMNGNWYPWSGATNANTPELFVRAWRRMVDLFRRHDATNVSFVWAPNTVDVPASNSLERYYPGAEYVDVLALDGYNWGAGSPQHGGWQTFAQLFTGAYDRLRALGPQPIWITEVASSADGGDKAAWVRAMFATARTMHRLRALVWFNEDKERDWRAAPTPEVAAAFAPDADLADPAPAAAAGTAAAHDGGTDTAPAPLAATLTLRIGRDRRARASVTVRWRARNAEAVTHWTVALDGRRVRSVEAGTRRIRAAIGTPGRHRVTVTGRDAAGQRVVAATRGFRAARAR